VHGQSDSTRMSRMLSNPGSARACYATLAATDTFLASRGKSDLWARHARHVTKPLLMPVLARALSTATPARPDGLRRGTLAAQAFSWGGDIALLGSSERAFLAGVGSFFGAHVAYIAGFATRATPSARTWQATGLAWAALAPIYAIAAGRKSPELRLPVAAYAAILLSMFATSTTLEQSVSPRARRRLVAGTALFLASDTTLGIREFMTEGESAKLDTLVMATYAAGQWLIAEGVAAAP